MRETCTYGSMRGSRRKTAKSVLRVVEDRAGVPDNKGRPALLYTPRNRCKMHVCVLLPYSVKRADDKSASAKTTKTNAPLRKVGLTAHV